MTNQSKIISERDREILQKLLNYSFNEPEKCDIKKFRIHHLSDLNTLDCLTSKQLLKKVDNYSMYQLTHMGIYLLDSDLSNSIFTDIDKICEILQKSYKEKIEEPVLISDIQKETNLERTYLDYCIKLLSDLIAIDISGDRFDTLENITPHDNLFNFKNSKELSGQYLPGWFPDDFTESTKPQKATAPDPKEPTKPHGNTLIFSKKRNDVIEAAKKALDQFPNLCKAKTGNIKGGLIAKALDEKSLLFFPQYDGEPPLQRDKMARVINKMLKKSTFKS